MNSREARDYLNQIRRIEKSIARLNELLAETFSRATGTPTELRADVVQTSPSGDKLEQAAVELIEIREQIAEETTKLARAKLTILREIRTMKNERYVDVLYLRYVRGHSFEQIAVEMNYSFRYILNLHGWALKGFGMVKERLDGKRT